MKLQNVLHPSRSWRLRHWRERLSGKSVQAEAKKDIGGNGRISPKLLDTETVSRFLVHQYGLSLKGLPAEMSGGIESAVWSVKTDQGDWVVKVFESRAGVLEQVRAEVRLYEYLNDHGFCAPVAKRTRHGESVARLVTASGEFPLLLMRLERLRKCTPGKITAPELTEIARTAARIHEELQNYPDKAQLFDLLSQQPATDAYARFLASPLSAQFTGAELAELEANNQKMVAYVSQHPPRPALSKSVLHGDLTLEHAQFLSYGEVYLFDFADRSWGPIAYGLAVPLAHFYSSDDISFARWEELRTWFLEGYASAHELTEDDRAGLDPALIVRLLNEIAYLSDKARTAGDGIDALSVKKRYELVNYLLRDFAGNGASGSGKSRALYQWLVSFFGWVGSIFSLADL
jgi:Ser/Thr protein kinase RdoA (MazF antagonist)